MKLSTSLVAIAASTALASGFTTVSPALAVNNSVVNQVTTTTEEKGSSLSELLTSDNLQMFGAIMGVAAAIVSLILALIKYVPGVRVSIENALGLFS
ncbi:hypothetical protein UL82_06870 [Corynebacterium kutscheri]|uniref:Secreted protein n=1 Tax=Corynebacterium kutscheri TaxID=35755 RepID=A0A0F6TDU7_9CORY|nr:hypothetical protein [Corynebacterium kutscheri]AKE41539.1 hypothetical protein UL82_06870 [Corynebacterium kutscheri]VEH09863.1 Uncharacterised protein [Corynebacterium kutscheri]